LTLFSDLSEDTFPPRLSSYWQTSILYWTMRRSQKMLYRDFSRV